MYGERNVYRAKTAPLVPRARIPKRLRHKELRRTTRRRALPTLFRQRSRAEARYGRRGGADRLIPRSARVQRQMDDLGRAVHPQRQFGGKTAADVENRRRGVKQPRGILHAVATGGEHAGRSAAGESARRACGRPAAGRRRPCGPREADRVNGHSRSRKGTSLRGGHVARSAAGLNQGSSLPAKSSGLTADLDHLPATAQVDQPAIVHHPPQSRQSTRRS